MTWSIRSAPAERNVRRRVSSNGSYAACGQLPRHVGGKAPVLALRSEVVRRGADPTAERQQVLVAPTRRSRRGRTPRAGRPSASPRPSAAAAKLDVDLVVHPPPEVDPVDVRSRRRPRRPERPDAGTPGASRATTGRTTRPGRRRRRGGRGPRPWTPTDRASNTVAEALVRRPDVLQGGPLESPHLVAVDVAPRVEGPTGPGRHVENRRRRGAAPLGGRIVGARDVLDTQVQR